MGNFAAIRLDEAEKRHKTDNDRNNAPRGLRLEM
jgi:hypothetical protein